MINLTDTKNKHECTTITVNWICQYCLGSTKDPAIQIIYIAAAFDYYYSSYSVHMLRCDPIMTNSSSYLDIRVKDCARHTRKRKTWARLPLVGCMPKRTYTLLSVKFQQQLCLTIEPVVCVQYCLTIYFTYIIQQMVDWQGPAYKLKGPIVSWQPTGLKLIGQKSWWILTKITGKINKMICSGAQLNST